MLVLSRKLCESFTIDGNIKIYYLGINGRGQCKIGIEAPREITVLRQEVIDRNNRQGKK